MDLFQATRYFDTLTFQDYDFASESWTGKTFTAQFKESDDFLTIYNAPTRKRMLYCDPSQRPDSPVIRVMTTGEVFIVGALQEDSMHETHYRDVFSLHKPTGTAEVIRRRPEGPPDNPGWAVERVVKRTFADVLLQSILVDERVTLYHHGIMTLILPRETPLEPHDVVRVDGPMGQDYFVLERFVEASMVACRAVARGDQRVNVLYRRFLTRTYTNQQSLPVYDDRQVTLRVVPITKEEVFGDVTADSLKFMVETTFLGLVPTMDDVVQYHGRDYRITRIWHDPSVEEWHLTGSH